MCTDDADDRRMVALAKQILEYLVSHPQASDTAEGVRDWWLADSTPSSLELRAALQKLVADGSLVEHQMADGSTVYCARRAV